MNKLSAPELAVHPPPLAERHREELRVSGLTDETIVRSGIYTAQGPEIAKLLGWNGNFKGSGFVIPFGNDYFRVKLDNPRQSGDGKVIKYESPRKKANRAYSPPGLEEAINRGGELAFTEGEKKALAISQLGFACIGLVGVWGWQQKRRKTESGRTFGKRELISDLDKLPLDGRDVVIIFDSDAAENPMVRMAEFRLAETLQSKGATVRIARIPSEGEQRIGADDFIMAEGEDAFRKLLDGAKEAEKPPAPSPMDYARLYIEEHYTTDCGITLRWHRDEFWKYTETHYEKLPKSDLETLVFDWLDRLMPNAKEIFSNLVDCA